MSMNVHSVHKNMVPHIATPCLFGCGLWPSLTLSRRTAWALDCCFAWTFGTVAVLAQGGGVDPPPRSRAVRGAHAVHTQCVGVVLWSQPRAKRGGLLQDPQRLRRPSLAASEEACQQHTICPGFVPNPTRCVPHGVHRAHARAPPSLLSLKTLLILQQTRV